MDWTSLHHPSHTPGEPTDTAAATGLVFCTACHCLLASARGPAHNARVRAQCEPENTANPPQRGTPEHAVASRQ